MWKILILLPLFAFSLGLQELWESALKHNPELKAYREEVRAKEYELKADKNLYFPVFSISFKRVWQNQKQRVEIFPFSFDITKKNYSTFSASLTQVFYDFGKRKSILEASKGRISISRLLYAEKEKDILLEVAKTYLNLLTVKGKIKIYEEELRAVRSQYELAKAFYEKGLVAITDVLQAKVKLHEVRAKLRKTKGDYKVLLTKLSNLTGIVEKKLTKLEEFKRLPKVKSLDYYLQRAYEKREVLKAYRYRVKVFRKLSNTKISNYFPNLFGGISYVYTSQNPSVEPKNITSFFLGLDLSFQSLKPYYEYLSLKRESLKTLNEMENIKNLLKLQVKKAYEDFLSAKENLKTAEENLKFAKKYYELSLEQYKNQLISQTDLLIAEAALTQAKEMLLITKNELWKAYFELLRASGLLEVRR